MRVLVCAQTVDRNDPALGFFHGWVEEMARGVEHIHVIVLRGGGHTLPPNVTVHSLGKEEGKGRLTYLLRFFLYTWKHRNSYDAVFVHMNQIYVILGGLLWRLLRKRVVFWYAHGAISFSLRIAEMVAHAIVTSTPEGFRLQSSKVHVVGQGIDTALFAYRKRQRVPERFRVLVIGRVMPIKRCEVAIDAFAHLKGTYKEAALTFVGDYSDANYHAALLARARQQGVDSRVHFAGAVPHERIREYLEEADVLFNPSATGSLDKVGLEALAYGVPVFTSNEAFANVLSPYKERLMFEKDNATMLAQKSEAFHIAPDRDEVCARLSEEVTAMHSRRALITRIRPLLSGVV